MVTAISTHSRLLTGTLTSLGLIPFVYLTLSVLFGDSPRVSAQQFSYYSTIILTFLSGTLWGAAVVKQSKINLKPLLFSSNALALAAWICLISGLSTITLSVLTFSYGTVFLLETRLIAYQATYLSLRRFATIAVIWLHIFVLWGLR